MGRNGDMRIYTADCFHVNVAYCPLSQSVSEIPYHLEQYKAQLFPDMEQT